jgi:hypothetical protein
LIRHQRYGKKLGCWAYQVGSVKFNIYEPIRLYGQASDSLPNN